MMRDTSKQRATFLRLERFTGKPLEQNFCVGLHSRSAQSTLRINSAMKSRATSLQVFTLQRLYLHLLSRSFDSSFGSDMQLPVRLTHALNLLCSGKKCTVYGNCSKARPLIRL